MWNKFKDFLLSLSPQEQEPTQQELNVTRRSRALEAVTTLQECLDKKFSYQQASMLTCMSCQPNLIALYSHLENINSVVKLKKALSPIDFACESAEYEVCDLLTSDKLYIPLDVIGLFCLESIALCNHLEEAENQMSGPMAYNLRVLAAQLGTIRELSNQLIKCYKDI